MKTPWLARILIRLGTPPPQRDDVLGDLEESRRGWIGTHVDAARIALAFLMRRFASRSRAALVSVSDVAQAFRQLRRFPLTTITATVALTVGIGVATVGFAAMEALLFARLPFDHDDRWLRLATMPARPGEPATPTLELHARLAALEGFIHVGASTGGRQGVTLTDGRVHDALVAELTPATFAHLPVVPVAGRLLTPTDAQPGQPPVALISDRYRRLQAGAALEPGSVLSVGTREYTVVGVVPEAFAFPGRADIWVPLDEGFLTGIRPLQGDARLLAIRHPDVTLASLTSRAGDLGMAVTRYTDLGPMAAAMSGAIILAVTSVLLVIAANVGNLVLVRSFARAREFAVRAALGASRRRLVTLVAMEVLMIGVLAAILGAIGADAILRRLNAMDDLPPWVDFRGGPLTAGLVATATLLATLVAGAWPAMRATRRDLLAGLQAAGHRTSDVVFGRLSGTVVAVQIAVSVAMLHAALIVAQGYRDFTDVRLDVPDNVLVTGASLNAVRVAPDGSRSVPVTTRSIQAALETAPGVLAVGLATELPRHSPNVHRIEIEGLEAAAGLLAPSVQVSPSFFDALDARPLAGRVFTATDMAAQAPVAVVNEPFVGKYLEGRPPLGQRFRILGAESPGPWLEVVGVVPDLGLMVSDPSLAAGFYTPLAVDTNMAFVVVRTAGPPLESASTIQARLRALDPSGVFGRPTRLADVAADDRQFFGAFATALTALGLVTLALALVGVYSMMSLIVSMRTQEIGIRMALGATAGRIVRAVGGRAALQVGVGAGLGAVLAWVSLALRSVLVSRLGDGGAWTLPLVIAALAGAALLATWVPVRRALRVRPQDSLRAH